MAANPHHHIAACWRHLKESVPIDAMLALTEGRVPAGGPAWQAVLPLLDDRISTGHLQLLGSCACSPAALIRLLRGFVERWRGMSDWSREQIMASIAAAAEDESMEIALAHGIAARAIFRANSPLPLDELLVVMGRDWAVSRLSGALDAYSIAQLIG